MASYYRSWKCADLGDITLYSSDATENPDWYSANPPAVCPLAKCFGYEILNHFDTNITNSFSTGVVWTSSIIMLANFSANGVVQSRGPCIRFATYFESGNGYLRVTVGYGDHNSFLSYKTKQYSESEYNNFPVYARKIYIVRKLLRSSYADQGAPNYNGKFEYIVWFGGVELETGAWDSTYNQMRYTPIPGVGDPAACLLSTPCSQSTQRDQSEGVYRVVETYSPYVTLGRSEIAANLTDASGEYDPDPPDPTVVDPNSLDPDYPSGPAGGDGNHDRSSDPIAIPWLPSIGAQSLGAVTMYKLTSAEMGVFGQEMTASDLWEAVKLFFQNPQDYIIGCALVPFTPPGDSVWYPKIGAYTFNHAYPIISSQFVEVDCGTLEIDEYWGSCFDYEPYTQITLWLPYIGYRAIPVDQIMKKTIYVKYHIDCLSGDCIAFVGVSAVGPEGPDIEKVLGQFSGNCAVQMPYGSVTFDSILSSGISMLSGAGVFAATGGNGGGDVMANSAMSMLAGVKGEVQQGGTIGSSGGYMGVQKPYIIKRIRRQSLPENYIYLRGYPSNIYGTLSQLTGYVEVDDIQLNDIPAMEVERKEIIELLKGGVLL